MRRGKASLEDVFLTLMEEENTMSDIWTMIWKESKDLSSRDGWAGLIRPLILIGILGIALPLRVGLQWLALSRWRDAGGAFIPFLFIISFIGDAIAGERERHTLETLLASRMPDRAILLGKVIATVGYAWGMAVAGLLLGVVWENLLNGHGNWMFYHPFDLFLEVVALTLLVILLAANAGVLISLRAATVRQAQQILIVAMFVLVGGGVGLITLLPADTFSSFSESQVLLIAMAVLAVLDAILLGLTGEFPPHAPHVELRACQIRVKNIFYELPAAAQSVGSWQFSYPAPRRSAARAHPAARRTFRHTASCTRAQAPSSRHGCE